MVNSTVWKTLVLVSSIVAGAWAVDSRYVTEEVFATFKEGTIAALFNRIDSIDAKQERIEDKLDRLLEHRK